MSGTISGKLCRLPETVCRSVGEALVCAIVAGEVEDLTGVLLHQQARVQMGHKRAKKAIFCSSGT